MKYLIVIFCVLSFQVKGQFQDTVVVYDTIFQMDTIYEYDTIYEASTDSILQDLLMDSASVKSLIVDSTFENASLLVTNEGKGAIIPISDIIVTNNLKIENTMKTKSLLASLLLVANSFISAQQNLSMFGGYGSIQYDKVTGGVLQASLVAKPMPLFEFGLDYKTPIEIKPLGLDIHIEASYQSFKNRNGNLMEIELEQDCDCPQIAKYSPGPGLKSNAFESYMDPMDNNEFMRFSSSIYLSKKMNVFDIFLGYRRSFTADRDYQFTTLNVASSSYGFHAGGLNFGGSVRLSNTFKIRVKADLDLVAKEPMGIYVFDLNRGEQIYSQMHSVSSSMFKVQLFWNLTD